MDGWGHGLFGGVWMILFWGVIIAAPALLVWLAVRGSRRGRQQSAREILEERYARGEIDADEFEERKRNLD
ncbi:SHOCT domain-containing protein [Marinicauda algicola]|uniref:SHOCT domain-containing protein n=2 Tax=Marinicauda algicola TaxID=2029849 RepID=A0A4S2H0L3_9PROT|nr:SHOCT domain-containing protein [Marinicauda algicola]